MRLRFKVYAQILERIDRGVLASDSARYIAGDFEFGKEWDDLPDRWVTFKKGTTSIKVVLIHDSFDETRNVSLSEGKWKVGAHGENTTTGKKLDTIDKDLDVLKASSRTGESAIEIPMTVGEQVLGIANNALSASEEALRVANDEQSNANKAARESETARDESVTAKELSEDARDEAIAAKDSAIIAQTASENAQVAAEIAQSGAVNAKVDAINAKDEAVIQAGIATGKAIEAANSLIATIEAKDIAIEAKEDAVSASIEAQSYAKFGTFSLVGNMLVATIEAADNITDIKINDEGELVITIGD